MATYTVTITVASSTTQTDATAIADELEKALAALDKKLQDESAVIRCGQTLLERTGYSRA